MSSPHRPSMPLPRAASASEACGPTESGGRGAETAAAFAVAYAAYQRTPPSEREVHLAVARVRARLQGRPRRLRVGSLLAVLVAFAGAAYAAGSALSSAGSDRPGSGMSMAPTRSGGRSLPARPAPSPGAPARHPRADAGADDLARSELSHRAVPAASSANTREPSGTRPEVPGAAKPSTARRERASAAGERSGAAAWAAVAEAMADKDYARAEAALGKLASSPGATTSDAATRDKAILGLAQLALGRGDCAEASRLARRILQGKPSARARRRSEEVLARCASP